VSDVDWVSHLGDVSTGALLVLLFLLLATGRLVTRREADGLRSDRDTWRTAAEREHEARVRQDALAERGEERDKTMLRLLESIHETADRRRSDERS
jgi:hypothetical protein